MSETLQTQGQIAYDASSAILFTNQAQRALANASDFTVDSDEMLEAAGDDLRAVMGLKKRVEEQRTSITGPLNQVIKAINDMFRAPAAYLLEAEHKLKRSMLVYTEDQRLQAEYARREAEELARKERERLAEEQRQQEAAARAAAEAAKQAEAAAIAAAEAGDSEAAAAAQDEARKQAEVAEAAVAEAQATAITHAVISMPVAVQAPAKVAGISTSKTVDFEVVDLHALVKHVADHPELITLLMADSVKLRAQVKATGMNTNLPGIRVYQKSTMSARAK
jgi:membrane protein involved in colicin uptake